MAKQRPCDPCRTIRIKQVNPETKKIISNIAAHHGVTVNQFLKPLIVEAVAAFPQSIREKQIPCEPCGEIKLQGISQKTKQEIQNVAEYYGLNLSDIMKMMVNQIIEAFPPHMKREHAY